MNADEERSLYRLLQLDAALRQESQTTRKADALRNLALQLRFANDTITSVNGKRCVADESARIFQEQYENTVDCLDANTGLNNFAAGALAMCRQNRNESERWTSSLTQDAMTRMPCVQTFLRRRQEESQGLTLRDDSAPLWKSTSDAAGHTQFRSSTGQPSQPQFRSSTGQPDQPQFRSSTGQPDQPQFRSSTGQPDQLQFRSSTGQPDQPQFRSSTGQPNQPQSLFRKSTKQSDDGSRGAFAWSSVKTSHNSGKAGQGYGYGDEDDPAEGEPGPASGANVFKTAREQFMIDQSKKYGQDRSQAAFSYGATKKSLGTRRGGPNNKFVPPVLSREGEGDTGGACSSRVGSGSGNKTDEPLDERLKGIEPKIIELITNEIMEHGPKMDWDDIAGLQFAKKTITEIVVWPMLRPDIFTGLRGPPKGLLLFGPPGTGKTLIGKCIASQSKSTFFCISASSLTSKWVGEGEKMVRALFAVARCHQPAVIFIDEVDSLLSQRTDGEHEASRRIKTEFLVQLDGASTASEDRILVIGATNRPQEIDEAARRRFVKRLYIALPELVARQHIVRRLMGQQHAQLTEEEISDVAQKTQGYSGADMATLCREAALGPVRAIPFEQMEFIRPDQVPPITMTDFRAALPQVRPSVSERDLEVYIAWNNTYGSFGP